jgi:hypothetical protein
MHSPGLLGNRYKHSPVSYAVSRRIETFFGANLMIFDEPAISSRGGLWLLKGCYTSGKPSLLSLNHQMATRYYAAAFMHFA